MFLSPRRTVVVNVNAAGSMCCLMRERERERVCVCVWILFIRRERGKGEGREKKGIQGTRSQSETYIRLIFLFIRTDIRPFWWVSFASLIF